MPISSMSHPMELAKLTKGLVRVHKYNTFSAITVILNYLCIAHIFMVSNFCQ